MIRSLAILLRCLMVLLMCVVSLPAASLSPEHLPHPRTCQLTQMRPERTPTSYLYLYTGEQFDSDLGFYYLRARYNNPDSGRFWTMDSYEGSDDPLTLHKYLYCGHDPINRMDPTGHDWNAASLMGGVSIGNYLAGVGVSYCISKVIEASVSFAFFGDFRQFEWFTAGDLWNFVPGGLIARGWNYFRQIRLAAKYINKVSGAASGFAGAMSQVTGAGTKWGATIMREAFESTFGTAGKKIVSAAGETISLTGGGIKHVYERHMIPTWKGEVAGKQTFWPLGTSLDDIVKYADELIPQLTIHSTSSPNFQKMILKNGISVEVWVRDGRISSIVPTSGPGVFEWAELLQILR